MRCPGYGAVPAHEAVEADFSKGKTRCRACTSVYFKEWAAKNRAAKSAPQPTAFERMNEQAAVQPVINATSVEREVMTMDRSIGHTYRLDPALERLWNAVVKSNERGDHLVMALHGPHGSGKTDGVETLAKIAGRPLVKIDAKSMVDAESWFGTRGAVEGSTFYHPSEFVKAIQMRSVVYIDEYTRVTNEVRDVLNPLTDGSRMVLNPITGDRLTVHPECIIVLGGNVGYKYTGVFDVDPATTSRLTVFNMDYPEREVERSIITEHTGVPFETALRLVALGHETRINPQLEPVSTRQLLQAAVLIRDGLSEGEAVEAKIINSASDQGDGASARARLATLWGGIAARTDEPVTASEAVES